MTKAQIKDGETFTYYPDGYTKTVAKSGDVLEGRYAECALDAKKAVKFTKKANAPENKDGGGPDSNK